MYFFWGGGRAARANLGGEKFFNRFHNLLTNEQRLSALLFQAVIYLFHFTYSTIEAREPKPGMRTVRMLISKKFAKKGGLFGGPGAEYPKAEDFCY